MIFGMGDWTKGNVQDIYGHRISLRKTGLHIVCGMVLPCPRETVPCDSGRDPILHLMLPSGPSQISSPMLVPLDYLQHQLARGED
jgi:hypothetical protein